MVFVLALILPWSGAVRGLQPPYAHGAAKIDYSAMNEYVEAHYKHLAGRRPYFPCNSNKEPIYNARDGILTESGSLVRASLGNCGFQLVSAPSEVQDDSNDKEAVKNVYAHELQALLTKEFGRDAIQYMELFHPMVRGEGLEMTTSNSPSEIPTSPTASVAHIDNDIAAFDIDRVVSLVENNAINKHHFPRQAIHDAIKSGQRFLVVNCWRNLGKEPIQRAPLGIYSIQYKNENACFPAGHIDFGQSRWYIFPQMTRDECLLFKQFDRDIRYVSDLWHCALHCLSVENAPLRRSMDIRAFIVLFERVPSRFDRYGRNRIRPLITFEESEEFCECQGEARKGAYKR